MTITGAEVWRDYVADGIPASGNNNPKKADIRSWATWVEAFIAAGLSSGSSAIYDTQANLFANLVWIANSLAWVVADPDVAKNGIYRKIGSSGTGSWTRVADLPYSFIVASDTGAGTPNAIQATSSLPVSGSALILLNVFEANTSSPVTVSFNGGAPLTIKSNTGNDIAPGGLVAGMLVMGRISGSTFRLVSDQVSASIVAAAEAAQAAAEAARDIALSAVPGAFPTTLAALKALPTANVKNARLTEAGKDGHFTFRAGDYSAKVAADGVGLFVKADDSPESAGAWVRPEALPKVAREWKAEWFGLIDHATTDQTPVLQKITDAYDPAEGDIRIKFPPGQVVINGGVSNNPWNINKHGVALDLHRDTTFLKTVQNRMLIVVGSFGAVTEGNRIQDFAMRGGRIEGNSIVDTSDDYAALNAKYCDRAVVEGVRFTNLSVGVRFGEAGEAGWSWNNRVSRWCNLVDCDGVNVRWFPFEAHGVDSMLIKNNRVRGGSLSANSDSLGIRVVRYNRLIVDGNFIDSHGRGIASSTQTGDDNTYGTFVNNVVVNPSYGPSLALTGPTSHTIVANNEFYGDGGAVADAIVRFSPGGLGTFDDLLFTGNFMTATTDNCQALLRLDGVHEANIIGNYFKSVGAWTTGTKRCILAQAGEGFHMIQGNQFNYDYTSSGYGFEDGSGLSGATYVLKDNIFRGPSAASNELRAIRQVSSSATLTKGGKIGDDNTYINR